MLSEQEGESGALEAGELSAEPEGRRENQDAEPEVDQRALEGLKFNEALPERLASATLAARLADLDSALHVRPADRPQGP